MVFSSNSFLFFFFPVVCAAYFVILRLSKNNLTVANIWLLISSLYFYSWERKYFFFIIAGSILINYTIGKLLIKNNEQQKKKMLLAIGCILNIAILFVFKYLSWISGGRISITLPLGISFYTFQAISYIVDIYRGGYSEEQTKLINVGLYISFFPQLIAGPIVRYSTVSQQLNHRKHSFEKFSEGLYRFAIGLSKKVLLANQLAQVTSLAFDFTPHSAILAWAGAVASVLQIYFDFSGYSDMAIGLGKVFGFEFNENFNYPFVSKSITEYWRRWHISLGEWFRDYLYYPLSIGPALKIRKTLSKKMNRKDASMISSAFVLSVVWMATGLWHGANWTFVMWGLVQLIVIISEIDTKPTKVFCHIKTILVIILSSVLFTSKAGKYAALYYLDMFCLSGNSFYDAATGYWLRQYAVVLIAGLIFSLPVIPFLNRKFNETVVANRIWNSVKCLGLLLCFVASVSYVISSGYNPFIYFNF